tara:strand:- start:133 stop:318 length:186 start_codon:yes stop_codon:yes gene_type:complete
MDNYFQQKTNKKTKLENFHQGANEIKLFFVFAINVFFYSSVGFGGSVLSQIMAETLTIIIT